MAGMCSSRFVEPPNAACTTIALRTRRVGEDVAHRGCRAPRAPSARAAERRAMSSQIGWPDGASAECGSDRPSASPTTCDVAAVPRNWQPPPGDAQARQPESAASSSVISPCAKRAPMRLHLAGVLAVARRQRHAAGHEHARADRGSPASAIIIAGRPLSQVATPSTPRRVGSERISRRNTMRRVVAVRQAVEHRRRALRAAVARVGARRRRTGSRRSRVNSSAAALHEQPDLPVAGVVAERDRRAVGARGCRRACERIRNSLPPSAAGSQPMPAFCVQPNRSPRGRSRSISARQRQRPRRTGRVRRNVQNRRVVRIERIRGHRRHSLSGWCRATRC